MPSPPQLAQGLLNAGRATPRRATVKSCPTVSTLAATPSSASSSSRDATVGRGNLVPNQAQTGLSSLRAAQPRTAPLLPAWANHAQAANSAQPVRTESRSANRASSGSRVGLSAEGTTRNRGCFGPVGASCSGSSGGSATGAHISQPARHAGGHL